MKPKFAGQEHVGAFSLRIGQEFATRAASHGHLLNHLLLVANDLQMADCKLAYE
jgi:hypothetical protein